MMEVFSAWAGSWSEGNDAVMADSKVSVYGIPFPIGMLSYLQEDLSVFDLGFEAREREEGGGKEKRKRRERGRENGRKKKVSKKKKLEKF